MPFADDFSMSAMPLGADNLEGGGLCPLGARGRHGLLVGFVLPERRCLTRFSKFYEKAVFGGRDEIFMVPGTRDRLHRSRIEQAIFDEALINVDANDLTKGNETRGGISMDVL